MAKKNIITQQTERGQRIVNTLPVQDITKNKTTDIYETFTTDIKDLTKPINDREKKLREDDLNDTDKPISNILKRINRICITQFPTANFETSSSCSGHLDKNGNIYAEKFIDWSIWSFKYPHIILDNRNYPLSKDKITKRSQLFEDAVTSANKVVGRSEYELYRHTTDPKNPKRTYMVDKDWMTWEYWSYAIYFYVWPKKRDDMEEWDIASYQKESHEARDFLRIFREELEKNLERFDGIKASTKFEKEDFIQNNKYV